MIFKETRYSNDNMNWAAILKSSALVPGAWRCLHQRGCLQVELTVLHLTLLLSTMAVSRPSPVLPGALSLSIFEKLKDKRVVLASSSPRRKDILENVVSAERVRFNEYADNRVSGQRLYPRPLQRTFRRACMRAVWQTILLPPPARR